MEVVGFLLFGVAILSTFCATAERVALVTVAGEPFVVETFSEGRWALGFVVVPDCPACEDVITWFGRASLTFPEIHFALIVPQASSEVQALGNTELLVLVDENGEVGSMFGVHLAPTVIFFVDGIPVDKLEWPFTEGLLLRKLAESLLITFPKPTELLGKPAPEFTARNMEGQKINFSDLPKPMLLAFLVLGCRPCWDVLPLLAELTQEIPVVLVAIVSPSGLAEEEHKNLLEYLEKTKACGKVHVLLDLGEENFPVSDAYKVRRSPTFILVDGKGVVAKVWEGKKALEDLLEKIRARSMNEKDR